MNIRAVVELVGYVFVLYTPDNFVSFTGRQSVLEIQISGVNLTAARIIIFLIVIVIDLKNCFGITCDGVLPAAHHVPSGGFGCLGLIGLR